MRPPLSRFRSQFSSLIQVSLQPAYRGVGATPLWNVATAARDVPPPGRRGSRMAASQWMFFRNAYMAGPFSRRASDG